LSNEKKDYYEILGVSKDSDKEKIKDAYRRLALQYHPDRNKSPGAEEKFKEISEAYAVLSDDEKRKQYDTFGKERIYQNYSQEDLIRGADFGDVFRDMGFGFGGFNDIFSQFFGGRPTREARGNDLTYHLQMTLEEVLHDTSKEIQVPRTEVCATCGGSGAKSGTSPRRCDVCQGSGQVQKVQNTGFARLIRVAQCSKCSGRGYVIDAPCKECKGSGTVQRYRKISVVVPGGVDDGHTLRLRGEGDAGNNGSPPGDLYVVINMLPHQMFKRQGSDVLTEIKVNVVDAILGTETKIKTLEGDVNLEIPRGTQSETSFKIKGKGLPRLGAWGRGDEYVRVKVTIPKNVNSRQRELLKEFAKEGNF
jgi:molecular chaperone DnaJ